MTPVQRLFVDQEIILPQDNFDSNHMYVNCTFLISEEGEITGLRGANLVDCKFELNSNSVRAWVDLNECTAHGETIIASGIKCNMVKSSGERMIASTGSTVAVRDSSVQDLVFEKHSVGYVISANVQNIHQHESAYVRKPK